MASRKLTPRMALAWIDQGVDKRSDWLALWPSWRKHALHRAAVLLADVRELGFGFVLVKKPARGARKGKR